MALDLSAATVLAAIQGYLKEDYTVHGLTDQINRNAEFFGRVRRSGKEVRGKYAVVPVILQGNRNAVGARGELDKLPEPAFQGTAVDGSGNRIAGQITMRFNTGRFAITEPAIQASATSEGAFESALEVEMKGLTLDLANDLNRQHISGDGSGKLCQLSAVSGNTLSVYNPGGQQCWPSASVDPDGAKFLEVNDVVAVYSSSGTFRGTCKITAIDYSATPNTVTVDSAPSGTTASDFLVKASKTGLTSGNSDQDAWNAEVQGLLAWVDDSSAVANIDPSDAGNERWASAVMDFTSSPVPLNDAILHQMQSLIRRRGGQAANQSLAHYTTYALENYYGVEVLSPEKRFPNTTVLAGGYTALTFAGRPILVDKDCLPGHWWMLTMSELYCYNQGGFYWMDRDNMFSRLPDQMGWEATLLFYSNFGTPRRNVHGVIRGLQEPYRVDQFTA
ncbi:MAG: phage major capsid protein [Oligoflexia bacterium]|nr:phage major capsid protein [Oligoflexia bacterium]